jgi:thymidylate synthase
MFIVADTLDDLLIDCFTAVLKHGKAEKAQRGSFLEIIGASLELTNPRARLSRSETKGKPFSCLGELFWYLSGNNQLDQIKWYIPAYEADAEADGTLHGAYGPRLMNMDGQNQLHNVVKLLTKRKTSRRAVIQLFSAQDLSSNYKEIPCTTAIQLLCRDEKLHCVVTMRSNDAFKGLPHDVFCFTMLQEILAREIGVELGSYKHFASSLHLYDDSVKDAQTYLSEGYHSPIAMPAMPLGSQWESIEKVLTAEAEIRSSEGAVSIDEALPKYWQDLVRLLDAFRYSGNEDRVAMILDAMDSDVYRYYLERRKTVKRPTRAGKKKDAS